MDPNDTLDRIRAIVDMDHEDTERTYEELATLVQSLDLWLSGGGFPPDAWLVKLDERHGG